MVELKARLETAHHILHPILIHDYNAMQTAMQAYPDRIDVQPCGNPQVLIHGRDRRIPCPKN
jgi:hypothetical protein